MKIDLNKPLPPGADAADFLESGITYEQWLEWAKPRIRLLKPQSEISAGVVAKSGDVIAAAQANVQNIINLEDTPVVTVSQRQLWQELKLSITKTTETPYVNYDNVLRALALHPPFHNLVWYDEFYDKIFTRDPETKKIREWLESDNIDLAVYFQRTIGLVKMGKDCIADGILSWAMKHKRNEPKDWMEGLKHDGVERIAHFFDRYFGAKYSAYTHKASMNFWVGMVARIYAPGCKNDHMPVLEGDQGIGKSMALEIIGGPWFAIASENVQSKDFYQVLKGKMLIEIAELDSFGRAEVTKIKQVISSPTDRYRASYDRRPLDHKRRCVFAGTTNEDSYLRDSTGARRFWPIACGRKIDIEALREDREQLFAQAVLQYKQGDEWWLMPGQETRDEQEARRQKDEREVMLEEHLTGKDHTTMTEVARFLQIDAKDLHKYQIALGKCLRSIGFTNDGRPKSIEGKQGRYWLRSASSPSSS